MAQGPYQRGDRWQVKWREGGRDSKQASETFDTELSALNFKALVEQAGNRWPKDADGNVWIKGFGFPEPEEKDPGTPFLPYATALIRARLQAGRIGPDMSVRYARYAKAIAGSMAVAPLLYEQVQADDELSIASALDPSLARPLLTGLVGGLTDEDIAKHAQQVVVEDIGADAIRAFILWMRARGRAWKTIRNYHGFLHSVLDQAFYEELLSRNACKITTREIGTGVVVKKVSLTPGEFRLLHSCMALDQQDFIETAVGTGGRFGELTAARVRHWLRDEKKLRIEEAWKRGLPGQGFYIGTPKTESGMRDVYVSDPIAEILDRHAHGKADDDLLFTAIRGGRIRQNTFSEERWGPAVEKAQKLGLTKRPRFHDLRHTHITWLRQGGLVNEVIKPLVGHSDAAMTEEYGEVPVSTVRAATTIIAQQLATPAPNLRLVTS